MDILLVEDDPILCKTLCQCLTYQGHRLRCAADGAEALLCLREDVPDLVISDIDMPQVDGIELLKQIQQRFAGTPVVLMTGHGGAGNTSAAFKYGAYGYLQKPIEVEALIAGIRRLEKAVT